MKLEGVGTFGEITFRPGVGNAESLLSSRSWLASVNSVSEFGCYGQRKKRKYSVSFFAWFWRMTGWNVMNQLIQNANSLMKKILKLHRLSLALLLSTYIYQPLVSFAQSTAFTYNGRLNLNGAPIVGPYDMRFTLYDADAAGNIVGVPLLKSPVNVTDGLFTVALDFGPGVFTGLARWLNVEVRPPGGGVFTPLTPRQEVTSSPYAIRAQSAGTAADVSAGSVVKSLNTLKDSVTLAAGDNVSITPVGNTLTIAAAAGGGSSILVPT